MGAREQHRTGRTEILSALIPMALAASFQTAAQGPPAQPDTSSRQEPQGVILWFNSVLRATGIPGSRPVTICITKQVISWREMGVVKTLRVPDAKVSFRPWEPLSHTYYGGGYWDTSGNPARAPGDTFASGVALPLPAGLPRNVNSATWQARFESDATNLSVQWRWTTSAYSRFTDNYNALSVATVDLDLGRNGGVQPAGSPVAFKPFLASNDRDARTLFVGANTRSTNVAPMKSTSCGGMY